MSRRLPDGTYTDSDDKYVREWRRLGKIVTSELNKTDPCGRYVLSGFDPGMLITTPGGRSLDLDMITIRTIVRLSEKK